MNTKRHLSGFVGLFLLALIPAFACNESTPGPDDSGMDEMHFDDEAHLTDAGADDSQFEDGDMAEHDGDEGTQNCSEHIFEDVRIPMRDGNTLSAFVRHASNPDCKLPTILIQTPYNKENARSIWFATNEEQPMFSSTSYAFVVVDWRGFYDSKDAAVGSPQPYGQDGYDTVEWIATQDWSNGKVGTWGVSALCVQEYRTALQHPPHLKAAVPIFCQMNTTYDQYYPGGVLRQEYFDFIDTYFGNGSIITNHPYHDLVWRSIETKNDPAQIDIPMLLVSGWYDLYNTSTIRDFNALRTEGATPARTEHRLLIGPWIHAATGGETSAGRALDEQEMKYFDKERKIQSDSLAFFDKHLRSLPSVADTWKAAHWITDGSRIEENADTWPPQGTSELVYFLASSGTLQTSTPLDEQLQFPYDPDDPSPSIGGCTLWRELKHGPRYQDEVLNRNDDLVFSSPALSSTLSIRGKVQVNLSVATSGNDTDFAIRLTDVDENGKHLLIGEGIRRLKLREGFNDPVEVRAGSVYDIVITLTNEQGYNFPQGHRVGLIITSSNYKRFARNPNNGEDFYEDEGSSVSVQNTVYTGAGSFVKFQIVD